MLLGRGGGRNLSRLRCVRQRHFYAPYGTLFNQESVIRMRYLRGPIVALLAFIIGVAISPIGFYMEGMGCGRVIDGGGGFSIKSYRSTYFVQLYFAHSGYVSTEKANQVFSQQLAEAVLLVDHTPKFNKDTIGQRAVAVFFDAETNQYYAAVFWTDGRFLHSIFSSSYLHVIEFEKQNFN
jgi:hypothetical protein